MPSLRCSRQWAILAPVALCLSLPLAAQPAITVTKTATPLTRDAPGGTFTFDVTATNTGSVPVTLVAMSDDVYGAIDSDPGCDDVNGHALSVGSTYQCSFTGNFTGMPGDSQTDTVTVFFSDGFTTMWATDSATVTLTDPPRAQLTVAKTASPLSLPPPGGIFTFFVEIRNTGTVEATLDSMSDDIYGAVDSNGTCTDLDGTLLFAGASYDCSFTGTFTGPPGATQTDVVTVMAHDALNRLSFFRDDATVRIDGPGITLEKNISPATMPEPGGPISVNLSVTNHGDETVTLASLTDDVFGNVAVRGTCTTAPGTVLLQGQTYVCAFPGTFTGNAGDTHTNTATATASLATSATVSDSDTATLTLSDVPPDISVTKTVSPSSQPAPLGVFTFSVTISNDGGEPATLTSIADDIHGNLATRPGSTCNGIPGTVVPANGSVTCTFTASFTGVPGDSETDTVTVAAGDDESNVGSASGSATVTLTAAAPIPSLHDGMLAALAAMLAAAGAFIMRRT